MSNTDTGQRNPNPQGKGLVPILADWESVQPVTCPSRSASEFLRAYCLSSLVLSADFSFKPVVGKAYYLYATESGWNLSLIAPDEWRDNRSEQFLGACRLQADMTWQLDIEPLDERTATAASAREFVLGFIETLRAQDNIVSNLPLYASKLPYYQRMLATAMSKTLGSALPPGRHSMQTLLAADDSLAALTGNSTGITLDT